MNSDIVLAIETSTSLCSVALSVDGCIFTRSQDGVNVHSAVLLSMIDELLREAKVKIDAIDAVAVGQGPGSFTGLRIGVGVGQGIAYGAACPMIAVSSLQALVVPLVDESGGMPDTLVLAGIDARMNEVYWGAYQVVSEPQNLLSGIKSVGVVDVSSPEAISVQSEKCVLVGNGWMPYWERLPKRLKLAANNQAIAAAPEAAAILKIAVEKCRQGEQIAPIDFVPFYVRDNVAKKPSVRKKPLVL